MRETRHQPIDLKSFNLSLDNALLSQATQKGYNLSAMLTEAIAQKLKEDAQQNWLEENKQGIAALNEYVEEHGHFAQRQRSF